MNHPPLPTRRQFAVLLLILAVGGFVRFYQIAVPSLWLDEIWSIEMARGLGSQHDLFPDGVIRTDQPDVTTPIGQAPSWEIWTHLRLVIHPPLYFLVMRWWMNLFGDSAWAIRCLSTIVSLFAIGVFFDVCRLLHGPRVGLIAAAIMALAIAQIDIAQEARSYPQLIFLGLCCCDALVRIEYFGATFGRLAFLAVSLVATMLTHYFAAGALAALAIYAMIRLRGHDRNKVIAAFALAGLFTLFVWGWQFRDQMRTFPSFSPGYLQETGSHHVLRTFGRIVKLPVEFFCGEDLGHEIAAPIHVAAALILLVAVWQVRAKPENLLWILWAGGIITTVTFTDLTHHSKILNYLRYTIFASPAVYALIANLDLPKLAPFRSAVPYGVLAILAVLIGLRWREDVPAKMECRGLSQFIDSHAAPDELLVYYNKSQFASPGLWYMCYKFYSPDTHRPWVTLRDAPDANLLAEFNRRQTFWVMGVQPEIDCPPIFPGWTVETVFQNSAADVCRMRYVGPPPIH
jgi:uncharacterized membrane protein